MIVSHNELVAAVNKAFLGMRRTCGEADIIANMVADLQMVGLHGVRHFNNASNYLNVEKDCPVEIESSESGTLKVDLHQCSLACHLPVIIDYSLEKMVGSKQITIVLNNCHNRWLAYSELVKLAAKGIACRTTWENGSKPKRILYVLNRGCIAPELYFSDVTTFNNEQLHSMTIELSVDDFSLEESATGYSSHVNGNELQKVQQAAWREGIFVDDIEWETLKETATVFLVENSQRSLQGAGELV
ncbi:DUF3726 domain-containing protein [Vibrio sp. 404]|uniref:DUF3726 domain-containing protein n=1 Tax=Vibrio marinisediminis TaxID=2758441 RepID=A0A7W2FS05_9VIBR|nr:DUF3726 domain-containing protein [Vibrio marinisediminis]MBA5763218.1 DUF3726 domain-containing protein [Vibrio marinisediminis]